MGIDMNRKVTLPINNSTMVVALDFCTTLLVMEIENNIVIKRCIIEFNERFPSLRAHRLKDLQVETILCGAISDPLSMMLWHCGIEVVSGLTGKADHVIGAFIRGQLERFHAPDFQPGFRRCHGWKNRAGFRGGRGGW